ncbi:hypothetical protein [Curtobacterium sp. 9128]|uniref:hypothetical protein n=1 Tax=Curtobacterium sp. 9128 TaxID=1793722 RepID=UPI0011A24CFF|nr:hypothetical protein [Curtobacterium sp. 9128]
MTMLGGVRFDPEDLPGFAGELYDRTRSGGTVPRPGEPAFAEAVSALAGSAGGAVDPEVFDPAELLGYVLGLVGAEVALPDAAFTEPVDDRERRSRVEEAVRRLVGYRS